MTKSNKCKFQYIYAEKLNSLLKIYIFRFWSCDKVYKIAAAIDIHCEMSTKQL